MATLLKPSSTAPALSPAGASARGPALASLACMAALAPLAWLAYEVGPFERADLWALSRISSRGPAHGANLAEYLAHIADPGSVFALTALVCLLGLVCGRRREALAALVVVVGANLTTLALKSALAHPRLYPELGAHQIVPAAFPSGHSTAAAAVALALLLVAAPPWRAPAAAAALVLILAVSLSLLLLGDHFPSDILGGWLVALSWWFGSIAALRKLTPPSTRS